MLAYQIPSYLALQWEEHWNRQVVGDQVRELESKNTKSFNLIEFFFS